MQLRRLILNFKDGELIVHTLYLADDVGPNPGTKARLRSTTELVRQGLRGALEALEQGGCTTVGTSGFHQREDVLLVDSGASQAAELPKGA
jgi:hypothetical protein